MTPIATFLAGSLLSLLIPVCLLIALVVWYVKFIARVPETAAEEGPAAAPHPDPTAAPASAPTPGPAGAPGGVGPPGTGHTPGEP